MSTLSGFDEFIDMCAEMQLTDEEVSSVMRKALNEPKKALKKNAPKLSGRTGTSIKVKFKKNPFGGATGIIYVDDWRAMFQEFRNVRQSGTHVAWFERTINETGDAVVNMMQKELVNNKVR